MKGIRRESFEKCNSSLTKNVKSTLFEIDPGIVSIGKMLKLSKCKKFINRHIPDNVSIKEKSEQAYIPQTPPLLDNSIMTRRVPIKYTKLFDKELAKYYQMKTSCKHAHLFLSQFLIQEGQIFRKIPLMESEFPCNMYI